MYLTGNQKDTEQSMEFFKINNSLALNKRSLTSGLSPKKERKMI